MVSGSLHLISFIDVRYLVSFAVGGQGPVEDDDHFLERSEGVKEVFRDGIRPQMQQRWSKKQLREP